MYFVNFFSCHVFWEEKVEVQKISFSLANHKAKKELKEAGKKSKIALRAVILRLITVYHCQNRSYLRQTGKNEASENFTARCAFVSFPDEIFLKFCNLCHRCPINHFYIYIQLQSGAENTTRALKKFKGKSTLVVKYVPCEIIFTKRWAISN